MVPSNASMSRFTVSIPTPRPETSVTSVVVVKPGRNSNLKISSEVININIPFKIIGFPDEYMINGSQSDVLDYYNMSPEKLAQIAEDLIN